MVFRMLLAINLLLLVGLGALWIDETGEIRVQRWQPPAPLRPDLTAVAQTGVPVPANPAQFMAILDHPIFAPDRLPPPPPEIQTSKPVPPPDLLATLEVVGLYQGDGAGGLMGRINGKFQRVKVGGALGEWTLSAIDNRDAIFTRESDTRRIPLVPAYLRRSRPELSGASVSNGAVSGGSEVHDPERERQMREEATRENTRRQNEIRAKAGLLPIRD